MPLPRGPEHLGREVKAGPPGPWAAYAFQEASGTTADIEGPAPVQGMAVQEPLS